MENRLNFIELESRTSDQQMAEAVIDGLSQRQKVLPSRFFYDELGSELFERITTLPEYYLTRSEQSILEKHAPEIVRSCSDDIALVEFGSGSSCKTRILIEAILDWQPRLRYTPIDISATFLRTSSLALLSDFQALEVNALAGEYSDAIHALPQHPGPRLMLFLGSNIGNFSNQEATAFLRSIGEQMNTMDRLLVGIDLVKDPLVIQKAYNDEAGVTERFNKNILTRINRELGSNFDIQAFEHFAPYDPVAQRVEMRLVSTRDQCVRVHGHEFHIEEGEHIVTEWSHKYTAESFAAIYDPAELKRSSSWEDDRHSFSLQLLEKR